MVAVGVIGLAAGCSGTQEDNDIASCHPNQTSPVKATFPGQPDCRAQTDPYVLQKALKDQVRHEQNNDSMLALRLDQVGLKEVVCQTDNFEFYLTVKAVEFIPKVQPVTNHP